MKTLLLACLMLFSISAFACCPNIYMIQQNLTVKALSGAYEQNHLATLNVVGIEMKDFKMSWEGRDSGINCPSLYQAKLVVSYKINEAVVKYLIDVNTKDEEVVVVELQD